jgi:hypothetical protein
MKTTAATFLVCAPLAVRGRGFTTKMMVQPHIQNGLL